MGENDGNMVRVRLVFDDHHLLDKSHRSQGLSRCWFLLKGDITNIGDLASQIRKSFGLRHRIVLYMDEFVLPTFESTCIITDKDIIRVKRKDAKENNICSPCDLQDSENAMVHDMDLNKNLLANGSYDKEILTSCMDNSIHVDPTGDAGLIRRKGKRSKDQYYEFSHENELEASNNSDVRKKKKASPQMVSDGEEGLVAPAVRPGYICFQPPEQGTQQPDETQKPVLFDRGSSIKEPDRNNENTHTLQQTINNDICFKVDSVPVSDGLLPLPKSQAMPSAVDITKHRKRVINFEILIPLRRLPVKGDTLAYRYVEPSSSLQYPQISSPQVGEVSSFDYKTLQIILLPAVDYVFTLIENSHGTIGQRNALRYKEDGSLEIEYLSLVDVRLVKAHDQKEEENACKGDQVKKDNWEEALQKENLNEPNGSSSAEQNNNWAQWIPNKNANIMSWSLEQSIAPFAGGRGRGNARSNRAPNRGGMNNRIPNRHNANWNPKRNWNPNRSKPGFSETDDTAAPPPPWHPRPSGFPNPWELQLLQNNNTFLPPGGNFSGPEKQ